MDDAFYAAQESSSSRRPENRPDIKIRDHPVTGIKLGQVTVSTTRAKGF